ncbi:MAG: tRNA epoxyqueuosine(34) reductase QueG [Armatimonadota bacterium]
MVSDLRKLASELGLAALGIAPAIPEVQKSFPWAKSVVVTAICYLPPESAVTDYIPRGWVARVARSSDYHDVLRDKLSRLTEQIESRHPNARTEICVDTSPLPERKLALIGGIAWRGKNGNVFVEGCGSYAALGEIITDIDIPYVQSLEVDRCGECDRCVRACPTGAIIAPGVIDCSKCLSALTQSGGIIPNELRHAMGNRIYGCDTCQEVCPQNAKIEPSAPEFAENIFPGACPELIPLIELSAEGFREMVKESSIGWIRRARIRRNAAIAAGNLRTEQAVPALTRMLEDENPILREHAAWALGQILNS